MVGEPSLVLARSWGPEEHGPIEAAPREEHDRQREGGGGPVPMGAAGLWGFVLVLVGCGERLAKCRFRCVCRGRLVVPLLV